MSVPRPFKSGRTYSTASAGETSGRHDDKDREINTLSSRLGHAWAQSTTPENTVPMEYSPTSRKEINLFERAETFVVKVQVLTRFCWNRKREVGVGIKNGICRREIKSEIRTIVYR